MTPVEKMQRAITAIVTAPSTGSFGSIIDSDRDAFRGLHVTYATPNTVFHINQLRLDQISAACPLVHSLFDGSGLLFYSDAVEAGMRAGRAEIALDYSIMLDKNVCEDVRRYVLGKQPSEPAALEQLLKLVRGRREQGFNYDYLGYMAEELEHFQKQGNERPLQTFRALKRLDFLDEMALANYPQLSTSPEVDRAVEVAADAMIDAVMRSGALDQLLRNQLAAYAILLRAMLLRWRGASLESGMQALLELSIATLGKVAKMELYFGWKLLRRDCPLPRFFAPVAVPSPKAGAAMRGMAWDLSLFRTAEMLAGMGRTIGGRRAEFFLPFIASKDKRFQEMVAACPLRAIVFDHDSKMINSVFRDEQAFQSVLIGASQRAGLAAGAAGQAKRWRADVDEQLLRRSVAELEREVTQITAA